ncbi:ICOS ligand-like isoform X2 [Mastacembelus armatus]|uniref:ICOS ligand-like isoform X2 n=1 Tax=Mastacembelus armatus TaxID=205130 RepID=UPI000E4558C0|nr:ICOS ligand-like isoform X2 [Mastacembelus armatus]
MKQHKVKMAKRFLSGFLLVFYCIANMVLQVLSANIVNGTRGASWIWPCHHTLSEPLQTGEISIYWQGQNNSHIVVHVYTKGKEDFKYQSQTFKNRTKIFPDQLSSGNFSLAIEPLTLRDDQTFLEVILAPGNRPSEKLCQTSLYVAALFQKPQIEINQTEMTAACSTKGGYPKPEIRWSFEGGVSRVGQHEVQTTVTYEEDGTYSVHSTANITGLQKVTCDVYNPTSNQTVSSTKDVPPHSPVSPGITAVIIIIIVVVIIIIIFAAYRIWAFQEVGVGRNKSQTQ